MDESRWRDLLQQWSRDVLASEEHADLLDPQARESGWLGYPGASEEDIQQAEERLGARLPRTYREFLKVSNGWRTTSPFIDRVWSTREIAWFSERNQEWIEAYCGSQTSAQEIPASAYFTYGQAQDPLQFRARYLRSALEISDVGDSAIYLLNPKIVTPDGEWEAWFLANWLPGAQRYRSFWEMMQSEHRTFVQLEAQNGGAPGL